MRKLTVLLIFGAALSTATADTIAVIGTGNVGSALGPEFAAQGHKIVYGSRDPSKESVAALIEKTGNDAKATTPAESVVGADIVILAVPGLLVKEITEGLGDLSGKIIIDPTNPLSFSETEVTIDADVSNSEIIQASAPDALVVKAFNTLNWQYMVEPQLAGGPVSVPLAGDDEAAKARVAELVRSLDLEPIDVGSAQHARWLEGMAVLLVNNNFLTPRPAFNFHMRLEE